MISKPMRLEYENFIVNFYRRNPKSTNLDNGCMVIRITADKTGAIINKDTLIRSCIEWRKGPNLLVQRMAYSHR